MIILRNKDFSKSNNDDPKPKMKKTGGNGKPELFFGGFSVPMYKLTSEMMGDKLRDKEVKKVKGEVSKRLGELAERAAKGDEKAAKAVFTLGNNSVAMNELVSKTFDNPRVRKAARKGKLIGAAIPLTVGGALIARGVHKSKKFEKARNEYKKELKDWKERNKKK